MSNIQEISSEIDAISKEDVENLAHNCIVDEGEMDRHLSHQRRHFKKRFGIRPDKVMWPWPGASNLHLPFIDKTIRRSKPNFINSFASVYPTVTFNPTVSGEDMMMVKGVERRFHEMLHEEMEISEKLALGVDKMLSNGYFVVKTVQEFNPVEINEEVEIQKLSEDVRNFLMDPEIDPNKKAEEIALQYDMDLSDDDDSDEIRKILEQIASSQPVIKFKRVVNTTPHPSIFVRNSSSLIVPHDTTDIRVARRIEDKISMTVEDMEMRMVSGMWDKKNTAELLNRIGDGYSRRDKTSTGYRKYAKSENDRQEEDREGIDPSRENMPDVSEYFFWHKWPGDRLAVPSVLTANRDNTDLPLRFIKYPYIDVFGRPAKWPYSQIVFEIVSDRYYSPRGYGQMLDSIQTALTNNHNSKQNYMTIANSLNLKVKRNANASTSWIPGQPFYVNRMDDVQELNIAGRDISFDNEERGLKAWGEEYVGLLDHTIMSPNSPGSDARTKTEIDAVQAVQISVSGMDLTIYQIGMNKMYRQIWERYMQYGPDIIQYEGEGGEIIKIPKEKLKNRFRLFPTANIGNVSRQLRENQSAQRLEFLRGDPYVDQYELRRDWLANQDERVAQRLLRKPEQMQQSEIERQIFEIDLIAKGYTVIPKRGEEDDIHLKVIEDFLNDPVKRRTFPQDRLESLMNHFNAHKLQKTQKERSTTRDGRAEQEVAKVAIGETGRKARE